MANRNWTSASQKRSYHQYIRDRTFLGPKKTGKPMRKGSAGNPADDKDIRRVQLKANQLRDKATNQRQKPSMPRMPWDE